SLLDATRIAGYVPPEWLAEQIRTRDRTCVAPGCRQPAARTEIDHRIPYQAGGATSADNLNLLCKHHHRAKDGGGWTLTRTSDGTYHWTSPLGRTHTREPETWWQPTDPTASQADSAVSGPAVTEAGDAQVRNTEPDRTPRPPDDSTVSGSTVSDSTASGPTASGPTEPPTAAPGSAAQSSEPDPDIPPF
ncbi:HNH endonuclease signature motif containing protein, partial [Nakamurella aerolata]